MMGVLVRVVEIDNMIDIVIKVEFILIMDFFCNLSD